MTPAVPTALLADRIRRAGDVAAEHDVDLLLVTPGTDLRYLLDADGASHERLTCLVLPAAGHRAPPALVVPRLEAPGWAHLPLDELGVEVVTWNDGEDPYLLVSDLAGGPTRLAVADAMPAVHVFGLRDALPEADADPRRPDRQRELRMRKDAAEVAQLRAAGAAIDRVHARMGEFLKAGRTEAQVGADIAAAIVEEGHAEAAFVIVGSGPNGASPHHDVSDRVIESGDVVVVDIGGPLPSGYYSDCTRTYAVGAEPPAARARGLRGAAGRAGAGRRGGAARGDRRAGRRRRPRAGSPTRAWGSGSCTAPATASGSTCTKTPTSSAATRWPLEPGMAFSVEPGVYLDGDWGARIEDIVVVTDDGCERLNTRPRDLVVL